MKEILQVNVKFELAKEVATEEKTDSNEVEYINFCQKLLKGK